MKLLSEKRGKYLILDKNRVIGKVKYLKSDVKRSFQNHYEMRWFLMWKDKFGNYPKRDKSSGYKTITDLTDQFKFENFPGPMKILNKKDPKTKRREWENKDQYLKYKKV